MLVQTRPFIRMFRKLPVLIKCQNWLVCYAPTSSLRSFHQSCILYGKGIPLRMPSLSPTMMEGRIVKWLKQEGDPVHPGDVVCDIETDKAVVSFEVDDEGVLAKILVNHQSDIIKIGTLIAVLAPEGQDWKTVELPTDDGATAAGHAPDSLSGEPSTQLTPADNRKYGPSVRLLLEQYGLESMAVDGSGPHGELLKGDVLQHVLRAGLVRVPIAAVAAPVAPTPTTAAAPLAPVTTTAADGSYTDVQVSDIRRDIAKKLAQSKGSIAHAYGTIDCRLDNLLALRLRFKEGGTSVSLNDLMVKAVAVALQSCPSVNCVWEGGQVLVSPTIDISVAVGTPSGPIAPIVRNAGSIGVTSIAATIRELAERAKENKLKPEEFQGGTFTISNLGMFGITEFSAIINPPQCAILAVGGSRTVLGDDCIPETRMRATLSYDRLAVDDDSAERFLAVLRRVIEEPQQLLLGSVAPRRDEHPMAGLL